MTRWLLPSVIVTGLCLTSPANALNISVGDWDYPSSAFNAITGAGDYYDSVINSSSTAAALSVGSAPSSPVVSNSECGATDPAWRVTAYLSSIVTGLTIRIKRTGNGVGGAVYGGESYSTLSTTPITLFCGNGDVSDINLQFQVDGLDVMDGYGLKTWNANYTVETL